MLKPMSAVTHQSRANKSYALTISNDNFCVLFETLQFSSTENVQNAKSAVICKISRLTFFCSTFFFKTEKVFSAKEKNEFADHPVVVSGQSRFRKDSGLNFCKSVPSQSVSPIRVLTFNVYCWGFHKVVQL